LTQALLHAARRVAELAARLLVAGQKVTPSAEEISSRRLGGCPSILRHSGPIGVIAFISATGIARLGALRPVAAATVSIASRIVVTGPLST
jgi:hypothetical protein